MNWFAPTHRSTARGMVLAAVMLACAAPARAQYFGQNKVQYHEFHFHVLKTSHFDIYYYPAEAPAAQRAGRMAERWYTRLSTILGHRLTGRQPLVLYASHAEFAQTNVVEGLINEGTGGVTEGLRRRVVLPLAVSLGDTDHVIGHELVHAFQYDMLGQGVSGLPLWFIEGMAEYLSLGPRDAATAMWLRDAVLENRMPTIDDLDNPEYFPYRFGQAFWAYIGGRWGDPTIGTIMKSLAGTARNTRLTEADAIAAIEAATELTPKTLSRDWARAVRTLYHVAPRPRGERAPVAGTPLLAEAHGRGGLNVGPALSPDGSQIAFLSERNRLAVDLYVADARTGAIRRRLTRNAVDPHFQSLQFIQSAGAWAPDNRRLAVAAVRAGRAELSIFDTATGGILRELPFDRTGEIFQPAWSPDGRTIAFSAEVGGVADLYTCDVASGRIRQRTHDAYADLEPAWSPDGRRLVFVTDRFTTNLDTLEPGRMQLAVLEVSTGDVHRLPLTLGGDATNPQWVDGATLLFLSDATGRPEVYRVAVAGGAATRLTEALTGVTGITPLSPALSVAAGRIAFSVFHDSGYQIQIQALGRAGASSEVATRAPADDGHSSASSVSLALLPPANRQASLVGRELRTPDEGLPAARHYPSTPYSSHLSLTGVGEQVGGVTSGTFGTYVSGGVSMLFSDMLGNRELSTSVGVNGGAKDISAQATYLNRDHRWNWGVVGENVPLLSGTITQATGTASGQPVLVQATTLQRQTYSSVGGLVAYPFSRATRLEISASGQRVGFGEQVQTQVFDLNSGQRISNKTANVGGLPSLRLARVSGALVRDTAAFGATGPILGGRLHLEAAPTFGDLQLVDVTADVRRYVMPVRPITLAGRVLHLGRYGGGAEDQRLVPLFLGYPTLVRGYDIGSFTASDCAATANGSCPELDELFGSRILVLNGEVRAPLVGLFQGRLNYGPIPAELFAFVDSGHAWTRQADSITRRWVTSAGIGVRVNLFGYAVAEFNAVRPLNHAGRGWGFVFNLRPGF